LKSTRRRFVKVVGATSAAMLAAGARYEPGAAFAAAAQKDGSQPPHTTELFLEATPGVSRRLHPAKKHLLNPVVRHPRLYLNAATWLKGSIWVET
jgi:hypothetical protein